MLNNSFVGFVIYFFRSSARSQNVCHTHDFIFFKFILLYDFSFNVFSVEQHLKICLFYLLKLINTSSYNSYLFFNFKTAGSINYYHIYKIDTRKHVFCFCWWVQQQPPYVKIFCSFWIIILKNINMGIIGIVKYINTKVIVITWCNFINDGLSPCEARVGC